MDSWSDKQLKCMNLGGNKSLFDFLAEYDLNTEPAEVRYQTKAADFYRRKVSITSHHISQLKLECLEQEFSEERPSYVEGREAIEYGEKGGEETKSSIEGNKPESDGEKFMNILGGVWDSTVKGVSTGMEATVSKSKQLNEKWVESETGQKVNAGAKKVGEKTMEYGGMAWEGTKSGMSAIAANETVQDVSKKTVDFTKSVSNSIWGWVSKTFESDKPAAEEHKQNLPENGIPQPEPQLQSEPLHQPDQVSLSDEPSTKADPTPISNSTQN